MRASDKEVAPQELQLPGTRPTATKEATVDTTTVRKNTPEVSSPQDRPHACLGGYVFIGHLAEEDGEEVEVVEALPCRRCADSR